MPDIKPKQQAAAAATPHWISILYAPRATLRRLLERPSLRTWMWPGILLGITWVFRELGARAEMDSLDPAGILVLSICGGPVFGIVVVYVTGAVLGFIGRRLGGRGEANALRIAYAWSWMPNILLLPLSVLDTFLYASRGSIGLGSGGEQAAWTAIVTLFVIQRLAGLWAFGLMVVTTSEVHGFSKWRAALTLVITVLVVLAMAFPVLWLKAAFWR